MTFQKTDFPQMDCPNEVDMLIKKHLYKQPAALRTQYIKKGAVVLASMIILAGIGSIIWTPKQPKVIQETSSENLLVVLEETTQEVQKEIIKEQYVQEDIETVLQEVDELLATLEDDTLRDL